MRLPHAQMHSVRLSNKLGFEDSMQTCTVCFHTASIVGHPARDASLPARLPTYALEFVPFGMHGGYAWVMVTNNASGWCCPTSVALKCLQVVPLASKSYRHACPGAPLALTLCLHGTKGVTLVGTRGGRLESARAYEYDCTCSHFHAVHA